MQVYILDSKYELLGVIDEQEEIVFNKRFNDVGYCALTVSCDAEMLGMLRRGNYIFRYDDDMFCKIEKATIETNVEQGDYLTVDAADMNNILAGRIVRWEVSYSGTAAGFIKKLITDNIINPRDAGGNLIEARQIENFIFDDSNFAEFTETINVAKDTATQDLLQLVIATCKAYNYGFRVSFNIETRNLVFRLYKGKNKATTESDEYVEFSSNYANIISSHYEEDESNYKNVAYVGYKSANKDDENLYLLSMYTGDTEPQGEDRREVYVDATSTSREITLDVLESLYESVTNTNGSYYATIDGATVEVAKIDAEGKITATEVTYLELIRAAGANALAERVKTQVFNGEVDTIDTYKYKTDYDLGDIVKVANEYEIEAPAQIVEITESESANSPYAVEPTFEYIN